MLTGFEPMTLPPVWRSTWLMVTGRELPPEFKVILAFGNELREALDGPASLAWTWLLSELRFCDEADSFFELPLCDCAKLAFAQEMASSAATQRVLKGIMRQSAVS